MMLLFKTREGGSEPAPSESRGDRGPIPVPARAPSSVGEPGVVECYRGPFHRIVFKGAGLAGYNEGRYADDPRRSHAEAHRLQNRKIVEHALFGREGAKWKGEHRPRLLDIGCGNGELLEEAGPSARRRWGSRWCRNRWTSAEGAVSPRMS